MASNHVQPGKVLDFTNATGSTILAGQVVAFGQSLGVALKDIPDTATGSVAVDGVFAVPKVSGAVIKAGEALTWDVSAGAFDDNAATPATGDITGAAAAAFQDAGNGATTLNVKFTGVPGTVAA